MAEAYVLDFVFVEVGNCVDNDPGQRPAKVHDFMHHERHNARCEDVILHVCVPCGPEAFEKIEVDIVLRDLVELTPVSVRVRRKS